MLRVNVTRHALRQWRDRVADTHESDLIAAVQAAVFVKDGEPTPFTKLNDTTYSRHATLEYIYFVMEAVEKDFMNLITVLNCAPSLLPPSKTKQNREVQDGRISRYPVPVLMEPKPDAPILERRHFWRSVVTEANMMISMLIDLHPDRAKWVELFKRANEKLTSFKEEWRAYKVAQRCANATSVFDANGNVKLNEGFNYLNREIAELRAKVQQLENMIMSRL